MPTHMPVCVRASPNRHGLPLARGNTKMGFLNPIIFILPILLLLLPSWSFGNTGQTDADPCYEFTFYWFGASTQYCNY